ncbi:Transcription initiation factor TFIID subunit 2 [Vermiconidia calcicola]|uniref:Transcription initiation factor TFIID subunit 2 n=1 Tax=Vermiconidia calcicola TaxID=1690605 RepID=A0ACC3NIC9_9PEZI|nr:Transcription initiation factor TFIID subunit 2 [Vermiconidia calcicola]
MPAFPEEVAAAPVQGDPEYSILKQRVDLDIDFARRSLRGSTEITVQPLVKNLKQIRLHCRQCKPTAIQVGGITAQFEYDDPYRRSRMPNQSGVRQHDMLKEKIMNSLRPDPQPELTVILPSRLKIQEAQAEAPARALQASVPSLQKEESDAVAVPETPSVQSGPQQGPQFSPVKISIEFEVASFRDGIHWVGHTEGDRRFPYMYTKAEPWAGNTSCIFPCVDDATSRCSWDISIRCAKTLGSAFRRPDPQKDLPNGHIEPASGQDVDMVDNIDAANKADGASGDDADKYMIDLSEEEAAMDLTIVCVGDMIEDVVDSEDDTRHTVLFSLTQPVTARHIGFAVGPFEHVDLSATRDSEEEERLGQSALKIDGYCLPGKSQDLRNTCYPTAWAMDNMGIKYGSFPFSSYQMLFVDDFVHDTVAAAGMSICSAQLLFPKTIIEPMYRNTRILVRTLADQWMGVNVIAKEATDAWVVAGIAGFMTDAYMKDLCGNNEFRWQQKLAAEKVYDLDVDRPSIRQLGELLHLDHSIRDFVNVKSAIVLFILDRRLMKSSGSTGVQRIINKIFLNAKTGTLNNGEVSTADFQRTCERLGHNKLELFFRQWVFHSGCPIFYVTQRFNKKKLVVEMAIVQKQLERVTKPQFEASNFMREIKEHVGEVWAPETNPVFTGPMTIRIHEADGTPYEHIVEIKEATTKLEIPYNTKYKRLKRSRRQKERQMAEGANTEGGDDALLYCLGDILDTEDDKREWDLVDWTEEDEEKMGQESYEWIRMDADFEWIGKIHLVMPLYMYISQLQQDRDIVAQYESMRYLIASNPHHVNLTILVRTLMDSRYFWGIREMAAEGLAVCAKDKLTDIGQFHLIRAFREMHCLEDTNMPKSNDFSDRRNFVIQCAIPRAMAKLRDTEGKVPMAVRQFFVDLLKFNDNSNNRIDDGDSANLTYSDCHYIAILMSCLADSLIASHREPQPTYTFSFGDDEPMEQDLENPDADFETVAIAQIERHRRIDEWDSSYQNIYSVTALDCLQRLVKVGIVKDKTTEVMKYVRQGNADNVRLAAWRCLSEVGVLRKMKAMRYLLHCLSEDASPQFRDKLLAIFGEALGHIALGDSEPQKLTVQPPADTGLILEQEVSNDVRKMEATRKTTPEGALVALKNALGQEDEFGQALWYAATSPDIALDEVAALCDVAALVYEPIHSLTLCLKLPKMWRCRNMGQGKVKFVAHGAYRGAPRKGLSLQDWESIEQLGLQYTGPLSEEVQKQQQQRLQPTAPLKLKISQPEKQQNEPRASPAGGEMPPPSVTPWTEKPNGVIKLNFGVKRKQSMEMSAGPRAGSPKSQKVARQQSPAGTIQAIPRAKGSPATSQRKSSTPSKSKGSKIVILHLPNKAARAQEILATPSQSKRAETSDHLSNAAQQPPEPVERMVLQQPGGFPSATALSPTNGMSIFGGSTAFPDSPAQTMNLGGFRSYGPVSEAGTAAPVEEKQEDGVGITAPSPAVNAIEPDAAMSEETPKTGDKSGVENPLANGGAEDHNGGALIPPTAETNQQGMPPPPKKKFTLKLGAKK